VADRIMKSTIYLKFAIFQTFHGFQIFLLIFNIPILDKSAVEQILVTTSVVAKKKKKKKKKKKNIFIKISLFF
jgi:hypothetical protein